MLIAYRAGNLLDAQLIADLLTSEGIDVRVFNQNAQSLAGEIPPAVAGPQVWVMQDQQLARARELIDAHQAQPELASQRCRHCGEPNPGNFLSCWCCEGWLQGGGTR